MRYYFVDIETNSLDVRKVTKIHCLVYQELTAAGVEEPVALTDDLSIRAFITQSPICLIGHNFWLYDIRVLEEYLGIDYDLTCNRIIDTLGLSWYSFPKKTIHGLDEWGKTLGIKKPGIDDWENLTVKEYVHRATEDVKITAKLFNVCRQKLSRIYGTTDHKALIHYLNEVKLHKYYLASKNPFGLDLDQTEQYLSELEDVYLEAYRTLEGVLPKTPIYKTRSLPAKGRKKDGTLSVSGESWVAFLRSQGLPMSTLGPVKYIAGYEEPKASSPQQVKDWLFSLGWEPCTFKESKLKDGTTNEVPQIRIDDPDGEGKILAPSVSRLAKEHPEILVLEDMTVAKHRADILKGFIENSFTGSEGQTLICSDIKGFSKTLRFRHRVLVNLPKVTKAYGHMIRSNLIAPKEGYELVGSDVSSLEDSTKQHYIWDFDPEYVKKMQAPGFDPHMDIAIFAGLVNSEGVEFFKWYKGKKRGEYTGSFSTLSDKEQATLYDDLSLARSQAKTVNFSSVYGVGARKLARTLGISKKAADVLLKAYWEVNWAVKEFAKTLKIKRVGSEMWVYNPVSKFYYFIEYEKDLFSTINQSTGAFLFDMWHDKVCERYPHTCGQFHDEFVLPVPKGRREGVERYLKDCMNWVNSKYKLNITLSVDVQFGHAYSDIH